MIKKIFSGMPFKAKLGLGIVIAIACIIMIAMIKKIAAIIFFGGIIIVIFALIYKASKSLKKE